MIAWIILLSCAVWVLFSLQKNLFRKWPSPIALLLFNQKVLFSSRSFRKVQLNPTFSHQKTTPLMGGFLILVTYEAAKSDPQGEFIASVCHELKTPLTIIKGFSEMMNSLQNPSPTVLESAMKKIFHASLRMEKTIQNLTTLEELEHLSSKQKMPCNLSHLIESVKTQLLQIYPQAQIEITTEFPADFTIEINPGLLEVAFNNLIGNALKYSQEHDPYAKVSLSHAAGQSNAHDPEEETLIIQVADRGIGIAPEELPKIFDRFYRSCDPKAQKRKGSGLGLAIAKRIIEGYGGTIDVQSHAGIGTTFTLSLPVPCPLTALPS